MPMVTEWTMVSEHAGKTWIAHLAPFPGSMDSVCFNLFAYDVSTDLLLWSVFQTLTVASEEAETVLLPSSVTATAFTAAVCPFMM